MEYLAYPMATKLAHDRKTRILCVLLNHVADVAQVSTGANLGDAQPHAFVGNVRESLGQNRWFAHEEHAAGIAVVAILDDRDVDIDRIALLEHLIAGDAVADHVIHRGADGFRVGRVAGRAVVQRRRDGLLYVHHVVVTELVELGGADARPDMRRDEVENLSCQPASDAHALDVFGGFDGYGAHGRILCSCSVGTGVDLKRRL